MKKHFLLISILLFLLCPISALASQEVSPDSGLTVKEYALQDGSIPIGGESVLTVKIVNTFSDTELKNIKLSFSDPNGRIVPKDTGTDRIENIKPDESFEWKLTLHADSHTEAGDHTVMIAAEYENSTEDTVTVGTLELAVSKSETKPGNTDYSSPKLMVTGYSLSGGGIFAGGSAELTVRLTNTHKSTNVRNIKLVFSDPTGEIVPKGTGTAHIDSIKAQASYEWKLSLRAGEKSANGSHAVTVSAEFETDTGEPLVSSDTLYLSVINSEEKSDASAPRLMVTGYTVENGYILTDSTTALSITVKNTNEGKAVNNIKFSLSDESGEIKTDGMGTEYISSIAAGGEYTWQIGLKAVNTASASEHRMNILMEYEDENGVPYSASDILLIQVRQSISLDYSGAQLPVKVVQGSTVTLPITVMNTGKGTLYNCKYDFDIDGLDGGGSVFIGTVQPGESGSGTANLRVSSDILGETEGTLTISCEDDYGDKYSETLNISTLIEEKAEITEEDLSKEEDGNKLWWLFLAVGTVSGAGVCFAVLWAINSRKQRKEDERRL